MKRTVRATVLTIGAALTISVAALTEPAPGAFAQAVPSPSPSPAAPLTAPAAAPAAASPVASPAATTPAPRAGGFPLELAWPMVAGGAAAVGAGALLLRRGKR
ncbi:MAG: hypothetical protein IT306_14830 [Chloroflexi bacterium]|nr:hypothetical protein [Chloroflexota bacterium]